MINDSISRKLAVTMTSILGITDGMLALFLPINNPIALVGTICALTGYATTVASTILGDTQLTENIIYYTGVFLTIVGTCMMLYAAASIYHII